MPRREGIWIASLYVAVARRIIQIEEEDLQVVGQRDEISGELLPPEWRRVHDAKLHSKAEEDLTIRVQKITFVMRSLGVSENGLRDEEILW
jgi:hypothetical protein